MILSDEENKVIKLISNVITLTGSIWLEKHLLEKWANTKKISLRPLSFLVDQKLIRQLCIDGCKYYTIQKYDMWETC